MMYDEFNKRVTNTPMFPLNKYVGDIAYKQGLYTSHMYDELLAADSKEEILRIMEYHFNAGEIPDDKIKMIRKFKI